MASGKQPHHHILLLAKNKMAAAAFFIFGQNAITKPTIEMHSWNAVVMEAVVNQCRPIDQNVLM